MKLTKLGLSMAAIMGAGLAADALALDLYVDSKTQQIFAEPGKGRVKLGAFEKVDDKPKEASSAAIADEVAKQLAKEKAEMADIKQDLELKTNELKAIEEHLVASREDKAKNDEKWFNKINMRGYTQLRYNQPLSGDRVAGDPELKSVGDKSIGNNSNFFLRRVRLVFSGDINDYISMYLQPDFATDNGDLNFAQLRDAYFDLHFDKAHEYRIRAGQSKIPFGWENLQSSQNRLTLDRADALNSAVPSERDLGLMAYWTPTDVQKLWKNLSKKGLKTSGDYGVLGVGVYNGQGINKAEGNDGMYLVAHSTYPLELDFMGKAMRGQVLEVGADAISGQFNRSTSSCSAGTPCYLNGEKVTSSIKSSDSLKNNSEDRVGVHAVLFPQPFGLQAEWNWGAGATLNAETRTVERQHLSGGYVQAMYKIDEVFGTKGTMIPYVKWQTYDGAWKGSTNAPRVQVDEVEAGVEYQINKALELTVAYASMSRTNIADATKADYLKQAGGDLIRTQLQVNY
ncbi:OprO/OprP family phosphate-selective porin [Methylomonas sp. SURF-2]|uniref:OprO/OprP family phosphate-selective porin n=1 Tax=Methylomonas subterranea TaxID=2952225 RepID=A0ABT1TGT2_9GAMM|nr:porin [Methylomonas sp. SURF-2]MCQ8104669.1 OprO/OprP family phosphate-selective porin [Methylomonas sp. SURF-2]